MATKSITLAGVTLPVYPDLNGKYGFLERVVFSMGRTTTGTRYEDAYGTLFVSAEGSDSTSWFEPYLTIDFKSCRSAPGIRKNLTRPEAEGRLSAMVSRNLPEE